MYHLQVEKSAIKYIEKLDRPTAKRIRDAIDQIAADPFSGELLTNHDAQYKYRVGKYRILYDVYQEEITVVVVKVQGRGDVYKR
jgi:mRNA interferase RelE/StbE